MKHIYIVRDAWEDALGYFSTYEKAYNDMVSFCAKKTVDNLVDFDTCNFEPMKLGNYDSYLGGAYYIECDCIDEPTEL